MIITVGYRVNSKRATEFRQWATAVLRNYAIRGYAIGEDVTTGDKKLVWGAVLVDVVCLPAEALYWIGYGIVKCF